MSSDLVWIDLEMTGLDSSHDRIIEMATIITDSDLNVIEEGPCWPLASLRHCLTVWMIGIKPITVRPA